MPFDASTPLQTRCARNATVSFLVVWEWVTPRFPIRHGVDGNAPARNPACALHLPDTGGPSSPTSPPVLPRCSTNDYVQFTAPACSPQRPGTLAGAARAYLTQWRRGPGLSYLLGRAGLTLASPYATFRWPCEPACQRLWKLRSLRSDRCFLIGLRVWLAHFVSETRHKKVPVCGG